MKREIRFRAKAYNGEWVFGYYFATGKSHFIRNDEGDVWAINPDTLGQFTGLTDKNGKEIYERDAVKQITPNCAFAEGASGVTESVYEIRYRKMWEGMGFEVNDDCMEPNDDDTYTCGSIEVLGNIYDNPELLED